mgnify:CR=1
MLHKKEDFLTFEDDSIFLSEFPVREYSWEGHVHVAGKIYGAMFIYGHMLRVFSGRPVLWRRLGGV